MNAMVRSFWRPVLLLVSLWLASCGKFETPVHEQRLSSGRAVKILSTQLAWGTEHDERHPDQDCFAIEYLTSQPRAELSVREAEAREVFELIRPVSEQWGFRTASVTGRENTGRRGRTEIFSFERQPGGNWTMTRFEFTR